MTVVLKTPWAGHPAGATLTLSAYDELALIRAGAATRVIPIEWRPTEREQAAPLTAPVTKPARGGRRKG